MSVNLTCQYCSGPFSLPPSALKRGGGKFCNRRCKYLGLRQPREVRPGAIQCLGGTWITVDEDDYAALLPFAWHLDRHGYAYMRLGKKHVSMHRFIYQRATGVALTRSQRVDH